MLLMVSVALVYSVSLEFPLDFQLQSDWTPATSRCYWGTADTTRQTCVPRGTTAVPIKLCSSDKQEEIEGKKGKWRKCGGNSPQLRRPLRRPRRRKCHTRQGRPVPREDLDSANPPMWPLYRLDVACQMTQCKIWFALRRDGGAVERVVRKGMGGYSVQEYYCFSAYIATCSLIFTDTARKGICRQIRCLSRQRRRSNRKRWPSWSCLTLPWTGICKWLNANRAGEWGNGDGKRKEVHKD